MNNSHAEVVQWVSRIKIVVSKPIILSQFRPLLKQASFFEAASAVAKIGSILKSNHHWQIKLA